jgi:hypothetical protein
MREHLLHVFTTHSARLRRSDLADGMAAIFIRNTLGTHEEHIRNTPGLCDGSDLQPACQSLG